ncbi:hypothetical protein [Halocatena salina]|uniref:Uncharacterized protein n=1 Tax=Halocatena salina TaxID=2934340 RepID=A0A8U0A5P8_9EURY|nr:hypothetical protein [Halocatena salina]UPM44511.1 hypothetical protein MW046_13825 [Halocatena salina]
MSSTTYAKASSAFQATTRSELTEALSLLATGSVDISPTLTHEVTLGDLQEGIDLIRQGDEQVGRVVVNTS